MSRFDTNRSGWEILVAFVFDVNGVLAKGKRSILGAQETIKMLQKKHIPFILLTNSGGKTENAHVAIISERLGVSLLKNQFI